LTATGRQTLVLELYDRFFRNAFPVLTQKLGIVYTPVEVVDFIIHSVEDVLREEFGKSLGSPNVHILVVAQFQTRSRKTARQDHQTAQNY